MEMLTIIARLLQYTAMVCASEIARVLVSPTANKASSNIQMTVCFILEDDSYFTSYTRVAAAIELGIQHANSFILPKPLTLQTIYQSSGDSCTKTLYSVVENVYELLNGGVKCNVFLGPTCPYTAAALYGFAKHFNIPIFGLPAMGSWSLLSNAQKKDFPLILQPAFGFSDLTYFITAFLALCDYRDITVFRDDSYPFYSMLTDAFTRFIRDRNQELFKNTVVISLFSKSTTREMYTSMLKNANERSRVFILFLHATAIREIMIAAHLSGLASGDHMASAAYQSLLVISFQENKEIYDHQFDTEIKMSAREKFNYTFQALETIDPVIMAHYDAIIIYAHVLSDLAEGKLDYSNGGNVLRRFVNQTFANNRGGTISIGTDGQRKKNYCMKSYNNHTKEFEVFLHNTQPVLPNGSFCDCDTNALPWPSSTGRMPPNEPPCGFRGDKCYISGLSSAQLTTAVVVPLLIVTSVTIIAVLVFVKVWRFKTEFYHPDWWKIASDDLIINKRKMSVGSMRSLKSVLTTRTSRTGFSSLTGDASGTYKGIPVGLTDVSSLRVTPSKSLIEDLTKIRTVDHGNLQHFIGISLTSAGICHYIIAEICVKGSLWDILENEVLQLDWAFKNSLIRDVVFGMACLHASSVTSHGNLNSVICLIDSRFTLKISDYGFPEFRKKDELMPPRPSDTARSYISLLWRAPELLRQVMPPKGTQKGDVYSFAIILQQIILRSGPFELPGERLDLSERDLVQELISANIPPIRPRVPHSACSNELYDLMEHCWEEDPFARPTFLKIKERLRRVLGNIGDNIVDLLFKRIAQYASDLEQKVAEQTQQFMEEKNRSEQLLSQLLPKSVASSLTKGVHVLPEAFESVTIFFSDVVGFTTISAKSSPMDVIDLLNCLYTFFDGILENYDVYKVETIGDAYMVSSGLPVRNGNKHVAEISYMALDLQKGISKFVVFGSQETIQIRVGINSGPCVAGVVGLKMPRYCLFGDTVNVASRMESTGEPMKIQITKETKELLNSIGGFLITERGPIDIKGKGVLSTFWLINKRI